MYDRCVGKRETQREIKHTQKKDEKKKNGEKIEKRRKKPNDLKQ